jgi:hypothetical protein
VGGLVTYPLRAPYDVVTTPWGKRGSYWSCSEDSSGNGVHTGCDLAAPNGTPIYAPIAGQIRHRSYGSAFGGHQFAISPDPGQPFADGEVFFAHTQTRLKDGAYAVVGDFIAEVGAEGNVSGPHLHLEWHPDTKGVWSCTVHADPAPILAHGSDTGGSSVSGNYDYKYLGKPGGTFTVTRSYKDLDDSEWSPPRTGWESTQVYLNVKPKFKSGKTHGAIRVRVMRENDDSTGHDTLSIDQDDLDADGRLMLRYYYWEAGEAGDSTVVQLMCVGGLESAEVSTRYTKRVTVVD